MTDTRIFTGGGGNVHGMTQHDMFERTQNYSPRTLTQQLGASIGTGFRESIGIGTVIRESELPALTEEPALRQTLGALGPQATAYYDMATGRALTEIVRSARQLGAPDDASEKFFNEHGVKPEKPLSESEFNESAYAREDIKWAPGMTVGRAQALSEAYDEAQIEEHLSRNAPWSNVAGQFLGAALDPVNYVPFVAGANATRLTARLGTIGARIATASADATVNTAVFNVATQGTREQLGDDVSFEAFANDVALAALTGGVFGAALGVLGKQLSPSAQIAARDTLATVENTNIAKAVMNNAIHNIIHNDRAVLSPAAVKLMDDAVEKALKAEVRRTPAQEIEATVRAGDPDSFARLDYIRSELPATRARLASMEQELQTPAAQNIERQLAEVDQLKQRSDQLTRQIERAKTPQKAAELQVRRDNVQSRARRTTQDMDGMARARHQLIKDDIEATREKVSTLEGESRELLARTNGARELAKTKYWADRAESDAAAAERAAAFRIVPDSLTLPPRTGDVPGPAPGQVLPGLRDVAVRGEPEPVIDPVSPETIADKAASRGVDENGGADIDEELRQLEAQGRLSEAELAELAAANDDIAATNRYADAMTRSVACLFL